jgi:two-component system, chemotaxis family, chemotaxis protein CheY
MPVQTLIIDDSESFRGLLRKRLMAIGCWVAGEAGTAQAGLQLFRDLQPDLVTLDIMMPDDPEFTAKELFATIRRERPVTEVVIISSSPRVPTAAQFLGQGATSYMEKSFMNFEQLGRRLAFIFPDLKPPRSPSKT